MRQSGVKRRIIGIGVTLIATAGLGALVAVGLPILSLGIAYKAKMLCSEVFVAGRRVDDVTADLAIDDLRALRVIRTEVDRGEGTATARFFPWGGRQARYRGDLGCTLVPGLVRPTQGAADGRHFDGHVGAVAPATLTARLRSPHHAVEIALDEAFSEPDPEHLRRTRAVIVMQHGAVVAERYAPGIGPETPLPGWSMTKSVLNALVGIAVGQGMLSLNDPAHLHAWAEAGDHRSHISVDDLLRMSSGLAFDESQANPSSDVLRMLFDMSDMAAFAASKPLATPPGTRWQYSSGTSVILSRALRETLGDDVYWRFPRRALFGPLDMAHAVLEADASGTFVASSYMYATAREWARFGQLYLQQGIWMGKRILPEGWVEYSRTPAPAAPPATYGAHFWLSTPIEYRGPAAGIPADVFQAVGHEGQFVTIVPSHDVVIVRLGRTRYPSAWAHDRFVSAVLKALARDGVQRHNVR